MGRKEQVAQLERVRAGQASQAIRTESRKIAIFLTLLLVAALFATIGGSVQATLVLSSELPFQRLAVFRPVMFVPGPIVSPPLVSASTSCMMP